MNKIKIRKTSIFMRYLLTCGMILLVALSVTIVLFLHFTNQSLDAYGGKLQAQCQYAGESVAKQIDLLKKSCDLPLHSTTLGYDSDYLLQLRNSVTENADILAYQRSFQSLTSLVHISNTNVHTIYSYNRDLNALIWENHPTAYPAAIDLASYQIALDDAQGKTVFLEEYQLSDGNVVFAAGRCLKSLSTTSVVGYFLVTEKMASLQALCDTMSVLSAQQYCLINASGTILSATDSSFVGRNLYELTQQRDLPTGSAIEIKLEQNDCLLSASPISETTWFVVSFVDKNTITNDLTHTLIMTIVLIVSIFMAVSAVAAYLFYTSVLAPVNSLIRSIQASGLLLDTTAPTNEIGFLRTSYDQLIIIIENLQYNSYFAHLGRKQLEIELLQAQINPHFLFNTLESIRMMAAIRGDSEAAEMTLGLSKILRYSVSSEEKVGSIREEIDIVKEYVLLQKIRLDNLETVHINIPKEYYDILIPKLTLQPIVENAIIHGLANVQSHGIIDISCLKHDSSITITVTDNGEGISEEQLRSLNDKLSGKDERPLGRIGIQNVHRRLKLLYGNACHIHIESTPGCGTTVYIDLPLRERSKA